MDHDGYAAAGPGLKNSYRDGRRAMRSALKSDSGEAFHAWRRRAKDHWYHVRLLENLWPEEMKAREEDLHQLETALGEDHNLLVLCTQLSQDPKAFGGEEPVRTFMALASEHQASLRKKAIALGERLYQERARDFEARIGKLWSTWQHTAKL
jgi:CHAD domain-containing protein